MGVPTIDGLGPIGGMDHSPEEYLEVDSIVPRTALLAALLLEVGRDPVVASWRTRRRADLALTERRVSSGGPWEVRYGYSRVAVAGDTCHVAGTTDAGPDGRSRHPGDPAGQARAVLEIIERALGEAGFSLADVVRTRMYVTEVGNIAPVAEVHGELFRDVRPASTARDRDRAHRPDAPRRDRGRRAPGLATDEPFDP